MKKLPKMKTCPFCGMMPSVHPCNPEEEGDAWGEVRCENEKCPSMPSVRDGCSVADDRGSDAYKAAAIRRWNKRAGPKSS